MSSPFSLRNNWPIYTIGAIGLTLSILGWQLSKNDHSNSDQRIQVLQIQSSTPLWMTEPTTASPHGCSSYDKGTVILWNGNRQTVWVGKDCE